MPSTARMRRRRRFEDFSSTPPSCARRSVSATETIPSKSWSPPWMTEKALGKALAMDNAQGMAQYGTAVAKAAEAAGIKSLDAAAMDKLKEEVDYEASRANSRTRSRGGRRER